MTEKPRLLPLGTAVQIKNDEDAYIIVSRAFQKGKDGKFTAGYQGIPHPFGDSTKYKKILIVEENILEILQKGYENEKDDEFIKVQISDATEAPDAQTAETKTVASVTPQASTAPKVETVATPKNSFVIDPKDPFKNLRNREN